VHGDVDATVEERDVQLAREQTLTADVRQGLVENLVAGGLRASRFSVWFGARDDESEVTRGRRKCVVSASSRREAVFRRAPRFRRVASFFTKLAAKDLVWISVRERRSDLLAIAALDAP
jgi:hypothetical protein